MDTCATVQKVRSIIEIRDERLIALVAKWARNLALSGSNKTTTIKCSYDGIGRHRGLKILCSQERPSSSLGTSTIKLEVTTLAFNSLGKPSGVRFPSKLLVTHLEQLVLSSSDMDW